MLCENALWLSDWFSALFFFGQLTKEIAASVSSPRRMSLKKKVATPTTEGPYQNGEVIIEVDESFYDDDFLDDFDETFEESLYENDNLSIPSSDHSRNYPVTCRVIYPYEVRKMFLLYH